MIFFQPFNLAYYLVPHTTITVKQSLEAQRTENHTKSVLFQLTRCNGANYVS